MTFTFLTRFLKNRRRYNAAMAELSLLSERDMADPGICKADFGAIARGDYQRGVAGREE